MISFKQSIDKITKNIEELNRYEKILVDESLSRILRFNCVSKEDSPKFNLSAMDGVVILYEDFNRKKKFKIVGESKAGQKKSSELYSNQAKTIYTGAPIPGKKKKLIIPIEYCFFKDGHVNVSKNFKARDFIRKKGSDYKKNKVILKKNSKINLRNLALLHSAKINNISVKKKPSVALIISGDEIINNRNPKGIIPSSNSLLIKNLVNLFGGKVFKTIYVKDKIDDIETQYKKLGCYDILVSSGGISKGKYDLIKEFLMKRELKIIFDQVAIKPGKPTTFGKFPRKKYFLGVPGNPVSCFISCLFFLNLIMQRLNGYSENIFEKINIIIDEDYKNLTSLTMFLRIKIFYKKRKVYFKIDNKQDSSLIMHLSDSNGIFIIKPREIIRKNSICEVFLFKKVNLNLI